MEKHYYEKYDAILDDPKLNPTFDEVLHMKPLEFLEWCKLFRNSVVLHWDTFGQPPRVGYDKAGIIENFKQLTYAPLDEMMVIDDIANQQDVIRNTTTFGNAVNQWYPTMMKTKITYSKNIADSKSIYDYFADDKLLDTFYTYASRHFRRDSFYHYSSPVSVGDVVDTVFDVSTKSVPEFIRTFEHNADTIIKNSGIDYFLCPIKEDKEYTGYNVELKKKKNLTITYDEMIKLKKKDLPHLSHERWMQIAGHVDGGRWSTYTVRVYKKGQRLFPVGLKAFRVSFCQYAVNFPPLTARMLYEKFTEHLRDRRGPDGNVLPIIVYDPSAGWGGRLIGAMSSDTSTPLLYIGTDPNTDHNLPNGKTKYHDVAGFFNHNVREASSLFPNYGHAYHIFQSGSETIHQQTDFGPYKGNVDMVFTSPPYFAKEVYSADAEQSCNKFTQYAWWRIGFLKPTLKTAVEWLRPGGILLWNIADAQFGGELLPLEQDSVDILEDLGMENLGILKMALAQMPGGNRTEETGETEESIEQTLFEEIKTVTPVVKGKMKNFCSVKKKGTGKPIMLKYEPIFVFRKPL